jgi:two-component system probable response regulator PhcQ
MPLASTHPYRASILLVDDEAHVTAALSRHFPKQTYEVITVTSAAAAHELLAKQPVDVIISDERMPGESGTEFLTKVRHRYPSTIRMVLSGQASLEAAVRAINEGEVYRFFLKPCNPTDLIFTIQRALEHRRLAQKSRELLKEFQRQAAILAAGQHNSSALMHVDRDDSGAVLLEEFNASDSVESLVQEIEACMSRTAHQ